ncbi:TetR/AcrR family transcriptional regulator [Nocardioides sp. WG-D5]
MPRNRRPQDREEKRQEIVHAAATLFTEVGYDETSTTKIATAAGVTTTTIYWYFADKDALLVAVLDHVLEAALAEAALHSRRPWADQVLWAIDRLEKYRRLVTVVHARASTSESIGAWHDEFHRLVDSMMVEGFRAAGVPESDVGAMTKIGVFVVEGLLMHPQSEQDRRAVVTLLTDQARRGSTSS